MRLLITGGAGFIGSNLVVYWCQTYPDDRVVVLDALTYAGNFNSLSGVQNLSNFRFVEGNIGDRVLVDELLDSEQIEAIVHLAAESHVDRSITGPSAFISTNIMGTFILLEAFRDYLKRTKVEGRFLHVSTDEVYGSLGPNEPTFTEETPYRPNSPYSASKASSDHLVRAYYHTYEVPTIITNCSNNYGPFQFPEKLIPLMCLNALHGKVLPIYGDGKNVRDWLYVLDHCRALDLVLRQGVVGESYNIGAGNEISNVDLVELLCCLVDELVPELPVRPCNKLITYVKDRPGHDRRYGINSTKIQKTLGWNPLVNFGQGLKLTVEWYLNNSDWWKLLYCRPN